MRFAQALALLERSEEQIRLKNRPPLLELRRLGEAEREFRREVLLFPDHLEAWGGLAVTQATQRKVANLVRPCVKRWRGTRDPRARKLARETLIAIGDAEGLRALAQR